MSTRCGGCDDHVPDWALEKGLCSLCSPRKQAGDLARNKVCRTCHESKPLVLFDSSQCRACRRRRQCTAEHRARRAERKRHLYRSNPAFRMECIARSRVHTALRAQRAKKCSRTSELLGCTPEVARRWLEERFEPGMSWANAGEWHVDHIIPVAAFNLRDPEEARMAFHYTNTQPMWGKENMAKKANFDPVDKQRYMEQWRAQHGQ